MTTTPTMPLAKSTKQATPPSAASATLQAKKAVLATAPQKQTALPAPAKPKVAVKKTAVKTAVSKATKPVQAVKAVKAVKTAKTTAKPATKPTTQTAGAGASQPNAVKTEKPKKPKLVRDSFTIPKAEYLVLDALKQRAANLTRPAKKSELLRAGIKALAALTDAAFLMALEQVPAIKTGRPAASK